MFANAARIKIVSQRQYVATALFVMHRKGM